VKRFIRASGNPANGDEDATTEATIGAIRRGDGSAYRRHGDRAAGIAEVVRVLRIR
jgi:hypothetical protein